MTPPYTLSLPGRRFIGLSLLTVLMLGCQPKIDPALVYGPDGQPRILSVQLPGIPDQNIQVDQTTHTIAVTVPVNFSATAVPTRFQLTADTRFTSAHSDSLYIYPFTPNDTVKISTSAQKTNAYQFVFKPTSEIRLATTSAPLIFTVHPRNSYLCIPIFNSAGGDITGTLTLTNQQTEQRITQKQFIVDYPSQCSVGGRADGAGFASIYLYGYQLYAPGDYTAEYVGLTGQKAVFNQLIRIQRGEIDLFFDQASPVSLSNATLIPSVYAANLFPTDKPSLILRSRSQNPIVVESGKFSTTQSQFDIVVPNTLQPGYYYAQLQIDGKPVNNFIRIPVIRSLNELVIQSIYDPFSQNTQPNLDPSLPFTTPIVFSRNKRYQFATNAYTVYTYKAKPGDGTVSRVRLTSLTDPTLVYLVPLVYDSNLSGNLQFLSDVLPGLYQLKFEVLTAEKTILSSQPLERDVRID